MSYIASQTIRNKNLKGLVSCLRYETAVGHYRFLILKNTMDLFQSIIIVSVSSASNNLVYRLLAVTIIAQTNLSVMSASTGVMTITTAATHSPTSSTEGKSAYLLK